MIDRWLAALRARLGTTRTELHGLPVQVTNTRPDVDTAMVLERLAGALQLIADHTPHYYRHLRRDFGAIVVERYACRGAYFPEQRVCLVELTFTVNPSFTLAQVAATILHEAMHARLHALGFPLEMEDRARQERFCRRAEVEFGRLVPDGAAVVERALASLASSDEEVAPVIDPRLADERIRAVDREARARGERE